MNAYQKKRIQKHADYTVVKTYSFANKDTKGQAKQIHLHIITKKRRRHARYAYICSDRIFKKYGKYNHVRQVQNTKYKHNI